MGPYIRYRHDSTHDVDHVRKYPRLSVGPPLFFRALSKVIRILIARREGEPGNEATILVFQTGFFHALDPGLV